MAHPLFWKSILKFGAATPPTALSAAETLEASRPGARIAVLAHEAELTVGWARGRLDDAATGAEDLGRVLEGLSNKRVNMLGSTMDCSRSSRRRHWRGARPRAHR